MTSITNAIENGTRELVCLVVPKSKWIAILGAAGYFYGREFALTYGPGFLAEIFIQTVENSSGSKTIGRTLGTATAPFVVPSVAPAMAYWAGAMVAISIIVLGNIIYTFTVFLNGKRQKTVIRH